MNTNKVLNLIKNKEWRRLIDIAKFELKLKQISLTEFIGGE